MCGWHVRLGDAAAEHAELELFALSDAVRCRRLVRSDTPQKTINAGFAETSERKIFQTEQNNFLNQSLKSILKRILPDRTSSYRPVKSVSDHPFLLRVRITFELGLPYTVRMYDKTLVIYTGMIQRGLTPVLLARSSKVVTSGTKLYS